MSSRRSKGFTLMEVLVVLVIAGFVSTVLFQALSQVYRLQSRFGVQLTGSRLGQMRADWFRQLVQGLQTDFAQGKQRFKGASNGFEGLSICGPSAAYGAPQFLKLTLSFDQATSVTQLRYESETERGELLHWAGSGGGLLYQDSAGNTYEQWPPQGVGQFSQLPSVIFLRYPDDAGEQWIVAVPKGDLEAKRPSFSMGQQQ